ncbi:MAG TPA: hypothetical protein VGB79_06305 [Allosphingosinicella sp.]|jgi:hypothetical protein
MTFSYLASLLMAGAASAGQTTPAACARDINASATAYRLSELPPAIRYDLARLVKDDMADSGSVILQTDAPSEADMRLPRVRFLQAMFVRNTWYVSFEVSMTASYTIGYSLVGDGSREMRLRRSRSINFTGPPCEVVKAALRRVRTFDPSIFDE